MKLLASKNNKLGKNQKVKRRHNIFSKLRSDKARECQDVGGECQDVGVTSFVSMYA